jgi:pimeloyl-ACP methyl ester carboxylesterase
LDNHEATRAAIEAVWRIESPRLIASPARVTGTAPATNANSRQQAATMRATRDHLEQRALPDRLTLLGEPLLVIFGEEDRRWRSSSAAEYRAVPGARVELLPGVGHSPMLEDPLRTAAPLLAFTAIHGSPRTGSCCRGYE